MRIRSSVEPLPRDAFPESIVTERLRLRRPDRREEALYARQAQEAYSTRSKPLSDDGAGAFGAFMVGHWDRYGFGFLIADVIEDPRAPRTIGHAGFKYVGTGPGHWGESFEAIELGYSIVPTARGNGYVTEAARALLAAGFESFAVPRISARCNRDNPKSAAVLLRCGMTELEPTQAERRFEIARPRA